jgi:hypothetical protein
MGIDKSITKAINNNLAIESEKPTRLTISKLSGEPELELNHLEPFLFLVSQKFKIDAINPKTAQGNPNFEYAEAKEVFEKCKGWTWIELEKTLRSYAKEHGKYKSFSESEFFKYEQRPAVIKQSEFLAKLDALNLEIRSSDKKEKPKLEAKYQKMLEANSVWHDDTKEWYRYSGNKRTLQGFSPLNPHNTQIENKKPLEELNQVPKEDLDLGLKIVNLQSENKTLRMEKEQLKKDVAYWRKKAERKN